jgi:hypothetical protein
LDPNGNVTAANVMNSTVLAPEFVQCVLSLSRSLRFPPPIGGGVAVVNYSYVLP